jgi:predicted AAA+ superfamily ATPase
MLYPRNTKSDLLESIQHSPVVLIVGARQVGKSTLAKGLFPETERPSYVTLDDISALSLARSSAKTFLQGLDDSVIIDEVQRAPELFLAIKESVDASRKAGRFILTGSANVLTSPKISESLAGRMEIHTLWPLSRGEFLGQREGFIDFAFAVDKVPKLSPLKLPQLIEILVAGGYPPALARPSQKLRDNWFRGYLSSIVERDIRDLSHVERFTELPDLLSLVASRAGGMLNLADLSRSLSLPYMTLKRYLALFEAIFLVVPLNSWSSNIGKRLVKAPKLYLNDTGLLCHMLRRDSAALEADRTLLGMVFENFVLMELVKQISWSETRPQIYHFRTADTKHEVDFVLESGDGRIVGIECKSSSTVDQSSFNGLRALANQAGKKFHKGIVLYTGTNVLMFDENLLALPISALWEIQSGNSPESELFVSEEEGDYFPY